MSETSRERVLKTFNHQQPEKMAIDFGSSTSTGISLFAYDRLVKHLGWEETPVLYELFLMMADPSMEMLDLMGSDVIQLKRYAPNFGIPLRDWKPGCVRGVDCLVPGSFDPEEDERYFIIRDKSGRPYARMPKDGFYYDQVGFPFSEIEEPEEIDALSDEELGAAMSDEEIEWLCSESKRLHEETDKAVMFPVYARTMEAGLRNWGYENWLAQLLTSEEMVHRYLERITDQYIADLDRILSRSNEYIDFIRFCDDLGMQTSTMMSHDTFEEMIKPYMKKMFDFLHTRYPKQKVALHCCGSIKPFIPDLIDIGVDILNPVQISARDMDPAELKREFGSDIVFWGGGCDAQIKLSKLSLEELKEHVREMIDIFAPGGGFLFAPTHNFQADITPEQILAVYETALKYR